MTTTPVGIVGPGRAGLSLGLALQRAGYDVRLHGRHAKPVPAPLTLTVGIAPPWVADVTVVLLAVRDDAIPHAAGALRATNALGARHTVLHLSGALDRTALDVLSPTGAALGSLHPLQALSDPVTAPERLRGAVAAVEGDARALEHATLLAKAVGLVPFTLPPGAKGRYHAGAVVASNYLVVLAALAERLFAGAGMPDHVRLQGLAALMDGTLANVRGAGPLSALTGPVVRGDAETITRHLALLTPGEAALYRALGKGALALAELDPARRRAVEQALGN
ncbi:MAG TPA: DUF2520 domain-containing protein [Gemmatimonadales bacterium]